VNSLVLHFGSRGGSWFALGLFVAMFGTLGWSVAREIRLRSKTSSGMARALGLALLVGPVVMVYASSLSGFYEAQVDGATLRLHYLFPHLVAEIALADVVMARPIPAIRGRQRLQIIVRSGRQYESATWYRDSIAQSVARLSEALPRPPSGRQRVDRRIESPWYPIAGLITKPKITSAANSFLIT
jgi:hypothetical protein